jgi:hypothetical protein
MDRRYTLTLAALPWRGYRTPWRHRVRTQCCRHAIRSRRLLTARLPGMAKSWARRTVRLTARLLARGLALRGVAGVRRGQSRGLIVSRHTRLRVLRHTPGPAIVRPQVLSGDDCALRTRCRNREKLARLHPWRFTRVRQWIWSSVTSLLPARVRPAVTAARAACSPRAKRASSAIPLWVASTSYASRSSPRRPRTTAERPGSAHRRARCAHPPGRAGPRSLCVSADRIAWPGAPWRTTPREPIALGGRCTVSPAAPGGVLSRRRPPAGG